jgi:transcriptional regulator with XRE-family HTH domain
MPKIEYDKQRPKVTPPHVSLVGVRIALGRTQREVSDKVALVLGKSFSVGALSAIELGHRGASAEVLEALHVALGLRAGDIVTDYEPSHTRRKGEEAAA